MSNESSLFRLRFLAVPRVFSLLLILRPQQRGEVKSTRRQPQKHGRCRSQGARHCHIRVDTRVQSLFVPGLVAKDRYLNKNLNASKPSEHPTQGEKFQNA